MICLAVGLGVLGAIAFRRARRCHHRGGDGGRGPYGHHHWHGRHRGPRSWMLHAALERIDASPAQERFIIGELDKLEDRVHAAKANLRDVRGDLGAAVRGPGHDDAALGAVMGKVDSATTEARAAGIDALRAIHGVLDEKQRAMLADLLDRGASGWWRQGPYR